MKRVDVIFTAFNIQGRTFTGDLTFDDTTPEFKNITLSPVERSNPRKEEFRIIVSKNLLIQGPDELKAVVEEASKEAEKFVCVFSVFSDIKLFGFDFLGYQMSGQFYEPESIYPNGGFTATAFGTVTTNIDAPSVTECKKKISGKYDLSRLSLFHNSVTLEDPISRFISLYMVLLHETAINGKDNQSFVDKAILAIDPTVAQFKSPISSGYETIFTKLRNELAHKRDGINILETNNSIRRNIDRFEQIVKKQLLG